MGVETILCAPRHAATPAMTDDSQLTFSLPTVSRKKVTAAFDGGRLSSDAGVMLLALAERRRKVADTLAAHIADLRDPLHITHTVADVLRARMLAIGCGYSDGNDFDWLRRDPAFKLACGRLPDTGKDVCKLLSGLIGRSRRHWSDTRITIRGDGHYGRVEAMTWCENNGVDYIFGLPGNVVLDRLVEPAADDIRVRRAESQAEVLRGFAEARYAAKSWDQERRVVARIEASASHADDMLRPSIDIRYVVTSLQESDAKHIYEMVYCARGQAENLIKQHKAQLSSDRTSCRSPLANQMRLILHTGAYWLLLDLRTAIPSWNPLRHTEFATIRLRLLKIAGRIIETESSIRIELASCCPEDENFSLVAHKLQPSGP